MLLHEFLGDLDAKLDEHEEDKQEEEGLAAGQLGGAVLLFDVSADPDHDGWEEAKEDGATEAACVAERDEEDVGVEGGDQRWGEEDGKAEEDFFETLLGHFEAVCEEVEVGERERDVGGGHGEEGKGFADLEHDGAAE